MSKVHGGLRIAIGPDGDVMDASADLNASSVRTDDVEVEVSPTGSRSASTTTDRPPEQRSPGAEPCCETGRTAPVARVARSCRPRSGRACPQRRRITKFLDSATSTFRRALLLTGGLPVSTHARRNPTTSSITEQRHRRHRGAAHEAVTTTALQSRPPLRRYACGRVASK